MLFNAFLSLVVALAWWGLGRLSQGDFYVAHVLCGLLGLVAIET